MRISDWSSDVGSSDLGSSPVHSASYRRGHRKRCPLFLSVWLRNGLSDRIPRRPDRRLAEKPDSPLLCRSEEHTSELQSLMRISYAVFCLKKKTQSLPTYIY